MIEDSVPWREELREAAARLTRRRVQGRWTERSFYLLERDIMVGAYSVRKLIDSEKTSSFLAKRPIHVTSFPMVGRRLYALTNDQIDQSFDLNTPSHSSITVARLCNQLVHSLVFMPSFDQGQRLDGIYVASDFDSKTRLYLVRIEAVADLFDYVGREDVYSFRGAMIGGAIVTERTSQHDAVENGMAEYVDDTHTLTRNIAEPEEDLRAFVFRRVAESLAKESENDESSGESEP